MEKRGQVWVETVVYTLIGLTIIGTLMYIITPKINQMNDRAIITQTINSLTNINEQIYSALSAPGNSREISLSVKKGEYVIEPSTRKIYYTLKATNLLYSQVNESVTSGDISILTQQASGKKYDLYLSLNYAAYNLTFNGKSISKTLSSTPTPYKILIENLGRSNNLTQINVKII